MPSRLKRGELLDAMKHLLRKRNIYFLKEKEEKRSPAQFLPQGSSTVLSLKNFLSVQFLEPVMSTYLQQNRSKL